MSVGYTALGIGWIRPLWSLRGLEHQKSTSSKHRCLLYIGSFTGYFIIAISSVGFLVTGSELERLQALLPKVGGPILIVNKCG
jgi:hypothetical protein